MFAKSLQYFISLRANLFVCHAKVAPDLPWCHSYSLPLSDLMFCFLIPATSPLPDLLSVTKKLPMLLEYVSEYVIIV